MGGKPISHYSGPACAAVHPSVADTAGRDSSHLQGPTCAAGSGGELIRVDALATHSVEPTCAAGSLRVAGKGKSIIQYTSSPSSSTLSTLPSTLAHGKIISQSAAMK